MPNNESSLAAEKTRSRGESQRHVETGTMGTMGTNDFEGVSHIFVPVPSFRAVITCDAVDHDGNSDCDNEPAPETRKNE